MKTKKEQNNQENKGNQQQKEEFSDFSWEESYAKGCKLMDGKFHVN